MVTYLEEPRSEAEKEMMIAEAEERLKNMIAELNSNREISPWIFVEPQRSEFEKKLMFDEKVIKKTTQRIAKQKKELQRIIQEKRAELDTMIKRTLSMVGYIVSKRLNIDKRIAESVIDPIMLTSIKEAVKTPDEHTFDKTSIVNIIQQTGRCPITRN